MIEEQGRVVTSEPNGLVWVETERKTTCSSCSARQGCGQHLSSKYRPSAVTSMISALSSEPLFEGDRVLIGIPEHSLMRASAIIYMLPLMLLMAALWLSGVVGLGDGMTSLLCLLALVLGFISARKLGDSSRELCQVKVVSILSRQESSAEPIRIQGA